MNQQHERYMSHQREILRQQARLRQQELCMQQEAFSHQHLPIDPPQAEAANLIYLDDSFSLDLDKLCGTSEEEEAEVQRFINYLCSMGLTMEQVSDFMSELKVEVMLYLYEHDDFAEA